MKTFILSNFREISLPSQEEIVRSWQGDVGHPLVSVICLAFNHEKYIDDAIKGFLIQKTNFPFEIIVHDDASTDSTQVKIKEYLEKYPRLIKVIFQKENQYSKAPNSVVLMAGQRAVGKYLAFCEGDDFWVSPDKLQIQVDSLLSRPDCSISVHQCYRMEGERVIGKPIPDKGSVPKFIAPDDIVGEPGQFSPTASYVVSKAVLAQLPFWFIDAPIGDYFIECYSLKIGRCLYIPGALSVYRINAHGSWTSQIIRSQGKRRAYFADKMTSHLMKMKEDTFFNPEQIDRKIAASTLGAAIGYLMCGSYKSFRRRIEVSYELPGDRSTARNILFRFRRHPITAKILFFVLQAIGGLMEKVR